MNPKTIKSRITSTHHSLKIYPPKMLKNTKMSKKWSSIVLTSSMSIKRANCPKNNIFSKRQMQRFTIPASKLRWINFYLRKNDFFTHKFILVLN